MPALVLFVLVGLGAQLVDGSLGMAYGLTSSTLLIASGVTPALASASVHMAELGTTLVSGTSHARFGNVDWRLVARLGVPGAVGAFAGATVLSRIATDVAEPWVAALLLGIGLLLLWRFGRREGPRPPSRSGFSGRSLGALGLVAGFVDATGGGGWGPIATPTLLVADRTEPRFVVGSVSASEFLVASAATAGFAWSLGLDGVPWHVVGALLVGGALAAPLAALMVRRMRPRVLGSVLGGAIATLNVHTLMSAIGAPPVVHAVLHTTLALVWVVAIAAAVRGSRRTFDAAVEVPVATPS